jgi:hypothetical protein
LLLLVTKSRIADLFCFHFWYNMRGEVGLTIFLTVVITS